MSFSTKLIKLRDANGWTQEELAERIGVSRSTIAKWEAGKGTPKLDESEMSTADAAYYTKVSARILDKMSKIEY